MVKKMGITHGFTITIIFLVIGLVFFGLMFLNLQKEGLLQINLPLLNRRNKK